MMGFSLIHNLRYLTSLKVFLHMLTLSFFTDINYTSMVLPKCKPTDIHVLKAIFCKDYILCFTWKKIHLKLKVGSLQYFFFQFKKRILTRNNIIIPYSGPNNKSSVPWIISCPCYYNGPYWRNKLYNSMRPKSRCWYIGGPMNKVTISDSEDINKVNIYKYIGSKTRHFNNLMSLMESLILRQFVLT